MYDASNGGAAIVGIGQTDFYPESGPSAKVLSASAFKTALADAGMDKDEVDGIAIHTGNPMGIDYDQLVPMLGLNVRHVSQYWMHGRWTTTALQNAALAVSAGLANVVAIVTTVRLESMQVNSGTAFDKEDRRDGGGPHGQEPNFGLISGEAGIGLSARRYLEHYGLGDDAFLPVVRSSRLHAERNPRAQLRGGFDADAYLAEPKIIDPIRPSDCNLYNDVSIVALVTSAERAKSYRKAPVYIKGMQGMRCGREEFLLGPRGLGVLQQNLALAAPEPDPHQVFGMAGLTQSDIDAFYAYDIYSPLILFMLERFGHCDPGMASAFAAEGHIAPGGKLPVNTSGGMISEGYACGWNSIAEIVRQLRGEAGQTQLAKAENLQWATNWGDSIIFGNARA